MPGLVFWPRLSPGEGGEVQFELQIDQRGTPARMPLIFIDKTGRLDSERALPLPATTARERVKRAQAAEPENGAAVRRRKRRYAPEQEPDATESFETLDWVLKAEGRQLDPVTIDRENGFTFHNDNFHSTPLMAGVDQPAFFPFMSWGRVRITQIERMTGGGVNWTPIDFDDEYRAFGFPPDERLNGVVTAKDESEAKTDIYLDILSETKLDVGRAGDRIGGPARPDATFFIGLSRSRGPVGGASPAVCASQTCVSGISRPPPGWTSPRRPTLSLRASKFLGIFTLGQVVEFLTATLKPTPQFKEVTHYISSVAEDLNSAAADVKAAAAAKVRNLVLLADARGAYSTRAPVRLATRTDDKSFDERRW